MRGSVIRQKSGSWRITVSLGKNPQTDKYEKYQETFCGTKREADKRLRELITQFEKGNIINPEKLTVGEWLDRWLGDATKSLVPKTVDGYRSIIENHLKPHLGNVPLSKLHPANLQAFYNLMLAEGRRDNKKSKGRKLSGTTVKNIHRVIHSALTEAVRLELVHRNVADAVRAPRDETREKPYIPQEKLTELLNAVDGTLLFVPTMVAVCTGMRLGEILGLRWADVALEQGTIVVRQALGVRRKSEFAGLPEGNVPKKGRNEAYLKLPKTKKSRRTIDIPQMLVELLKKHRLQQKKDRLAAGECYQDHDLVCCWGDGAPLLLSTFSGAFSKKVRETGLDINFHGLRHSHATWLFQAGAHAKAVSERLGHSKVGITLDLYTHAVPDMQKNLAKRVDEMLQETKTQ